MYFLKIIDGKATKTTTPFEELKCLFTSAARVHNTMTTTTMATISHWWKISHIKKVARFFFYVQIFLLYYLFLFKWTSNTTTRQALKQQRKIHIENSSTTHDNKHKQNKWATLTIWHLKCHLTELVCMLLPILCSSHSLSCSTLSRAVSLARSLARMYGAHCRKDVKPMRTKLQSTQRTTLHICWVYASVFLCFHFVFVGFGFVSN